MSDSTEVRFYFTSSSTPRELSIESGLNHWTNITPPLYIPADSVKSFSEQTTLPVDVSILGIMPHMHLLGKSINAYAIRPAGDTDKLIEIPEWDFHWQDCYFFPRFKKLVNGSVLRSEATYDNTSANPENPSSPPRDVYAGQNTTDEMMVTYAVYTLYQAGDEFIIVDSASALELDAPYYRGQQLLDVYPNPSVSELMLKCYFSKDDDATIQIVDLNGRVIKHFGTNVPIAEGYHVLKYDVSDIATGQYLLRMQTSERIVTRKIVIGVH
jgi:hypothetical protein